ncbi:MAG TPA: Gfo/Idh/MocA family oxidoreductase [Vicinamibacterales bacterium]|nr:Gfo/Idh/MocA family oxidoreductase [Vicinamibacterales bacterium]
MTRPPTSPTPDATAEAGVSRRQFVGTAAGAAAAFMVVPRHVLGRGFQAPSDTLNIAVVGLGGMGGSNAQAVMSQNIVAFCDCDFGLLDQRIQRWHNTFTPPPPPSGAGRAGGAGARQGGAPRPEDRWQTFGPSKSQAAADARWTQPESRAGLRRFLDDQLPRVSRYRDYREMLATQKDIDAVIVATPDHMHAVIASAAMDLGKHVYVQKPLCWSVHEARHLARRAAETKVVTQMGNQGHSQDGARRGQEYLLAGAIGEVREVHVWTNRPLVFWPQGIPRPAPLTRDEARIGWGNRALMDRLANAMTGDHPVPDQLAWNLFLGVAPDVPYHPVYHPFNWRGWVDWGQGALGDMGAHLIDHPVWGLRLGLPTVIETASTPFNGATYPHATTTHYEFPARDGMPPVKLTWYDGGLTPPRPEELGEEKLSGEGGILYIGSKGKMIQETYGRNPRLLPFEAHNNYGPPAERLARVPHQAHEMNWVNAIKGTDDISCPFSYAAPLTEIMLLGIVALRAGTKIHYDAAEMRVTNDPAANELLTRAYRPGYSL